MKPRALKFPFSYAERRPLLLDDVLYVPRCYLLHQEWDASDLHRHLSSFSSVSIEYCSGNGAWIAEKAAQHPDTLWIAVEKRFDRVQKIWAKKHNLCLTNLLIVCGDAYTFSHYYLPQQCAQQIFINFPDPWPKNKHAKHRLIQSPFTDELNRILQLQGQVTCVTDDVPYSLQIVQEMQKIPLWKPGFADPFYTTTWDAYGSSYFENLWKSQGKTIHYITFYKVGCHGG